MAIKFSFNPASVLLMCPQFLRQQNVALAFDAFISFLKQMDVATNSLSSNLLSASVQRKVHDPYLMAAEVYSVINLSHNIFKLYPVVGIDNTPARVELRAKIALVNHCFDNVSEWLSTCSHVHKQPGSILGDFEWQYREKIEDSIIAFYCKTGTTMQSTIVGELGALTNKEKLEKYDGYTGVFGLKFHYAKPSTHSEEIFEKITLDLEEIILDLSTMVSRIESGYNRLLTQTINSDSEAVIDSPRIQPMTLFVTQ